MSATTEARLGRYRLEGLIGRGGMAEVHRATDTTLGRTVAVKVIGQPHSADATFLERFRREAQLVAALDHPHVLPVWDYGEDEGRPFLVMPFVDGGTLRDRIAAGPLPIAEARAVVRQIAAALDAAHAAGILHRDIKPANVLIDREGRAILADFGIARSAGQATTLTATGTVIGTPTYMAPELAQGGTASRASDLYALAAMAWEMIAGRPPYEGENPLSVLHQHVTRPVPALGPRGGTDAPRLDAFFRRALAKTADERPPSGAELAARFDAAAGGPDAAATLPMTLPGSRTTMPGGAAAAPPGRSVSPLAIVAGCVLLVMVVSLALSTLRAPRDEPTAVPDPAAAAKSAVAAPGDGPSARPPAASVPATTPTGPATRGADDAAAADARPPAAAASFEIPPLVGPAPRTLAARLARPDRMDAASWQEVAGRAAQRDTADGWGALLATWAAGALAHERGDDETAAAALDAMRDALSAHDAAAPGVLGLVATNGAEHDAWEMAVAFGDPRGDGLAAADRALAEDPGDGRVLLGRALLLHMHADHAGAARDAGAAYERVNAAGHAAAADLALFAAAEYEEAAMPSEAVSWYERAASFGGRAAERALARGVPLALRETGERWSAVRLLRSACDAGYAAACERLRGEHDGGRPSIRTRDGRPRSRR